MIEGSLTKYPRHVWWNGGYFGVIFQIRGILPKAEVLCFHISSYIAKVDLGRQSQQSQLLSNFISGSLGGFAGTVLNTP